MPACPKLATIVETLTIEPSPRSAMAGASDTTRKNGTLTLSAKVSSNSASVAAFAWSEQGDASVVDEDVDVTVACLSGPLDQVPGRFQIAQRSELEYSATAAAFDLGDHVFGSLFVGSDCTSTYDAGAQCYGRRLADPARRARYQSRLALQVSHAICRPLALKWVVRLTLAAGHWVVNLNTVVPLVHGRRDE